MSRLFTVLALVAFVAPAALAQGYGPYPYNGLYQPNPLGAPGVRVGIGVGPYIYTGPDILVGDAAFQDDVVSTALGVTGEVSFPLGSDRLYGRLLGGLLNIGADNNRPDVGTYAFDGTFTQDDRANPFLTSQTVLAEANLLYYLNPAYVGSFAPYVFSGVSGLFATGDALPGVSTSALAIPVGLGFEYRFSPSLSLFGEASYRFGVTSVGESQSLSFANGGVDCSKPENKMLPECKRPTPPNCDTNPYQAGCPGVNGEGDSDFRTRFNSGLILGGLRLGFGAPPPPPVLPPVRETCETNPYLPECRPLPPITPPVTPAVCDLVELNSVYFDFGSGTLTTRARTLLDENVQLLLSNPECCVFIDGYTDTPESTRFGMGLAGRRAQAVYDYYLSRGVTASRLQIRNKGVDAPNCDKEDPGAGCERNRRVESIPVDCERFRYLLENPTYDRY